MIDPDLATFKDFNATTFADAELVACTAFKSAGMSAYLRKILANPYAKEQKFDIHGDIAYVDGNPVAFQAVMLHRLYNGQQPFNSTVGSSLGIVPGTSPVVLFNLLERSICPRKGSRLFFGNTAIKASVRLNRSLGVRKTGGESWKGYRYAVIHPIKFLCYLFETKVIKKTVFQKEFLVSPDRKFLRKDACFEVVREIEIKRSVFADFWSAYLKYNQGVVSSRTPDELEWMFGDNLRMGKDVLLSAYADGLMRGYIVVRSAADCRWKVVDMIAVKNDPAVLSVLLASAKKFLRKHTRAAMLRIFGFPDFIQPVIARHFPYRRPGDNIPFIYQPYDIPKETSWFFGPYDGDAAF